MKKQFARHTDTTQPQLDVCQRGEKAKMKRGMTEKQKDSREAVFYINGTPIETVQCFKYLGRWISNDDDDLPAVKANLKKSTLPLGHGCTFTLP